MQVFDDDLIRDVLARVIAMSDSFTQAEAVQIEEQVHAARGGEVYRVAKRVDNPKSSRYGPHMKQAITTEIERGTPPREAARKFGVHRATIYRLMKRD